MNNDEMFGSSMFGFDKEEVNSYIEKMVKEFETKIKLKDEEINLLRIQTKELKEKNENVSKNSNNFNSDKNKIIEVLMKAQEKADSIIEEAKEKAFTETKHLEEKLTKERMKISYEIETEQQKLDKLKSELQTLKRDSIKTVERFHREVDNIFEDVITVDEFVNDSLINNK